MIATSTKIACAALLMKAGLVVAGARHYSPEMRTILRRIYGADYTYEVVTQGFVNTRGEFFNREDARVIALRHGQITDNTIHETELFSEDLY